MRPGERQRTTPGSGRFARHADWALFVAGGVALAGGLLTQQDTAVTMLVVLVAAALLLTGALLPRLSGTIKVSPTGIELQVLERLESTRAEAERVAPDHVTEALYRAYIELRPFLVDAGRFDPEGGTHRPNSDDVQRRPAPAAAREPVSLGTEPEGPPEEAGDGLCAQCGQQNQPADVFCADCGHYLAWDGEESTVADEWAVDAPAPSAPPMDGTDAVPAPTGTPPGARMPSGGRSTSENLLGESPHEFAARILSTVQADQQGDVPGERDA